MHPLKPTRRWRVQIALTAAAIAAAATPVQAAHAASSPPSPPPGGPATCDPYAGSDQCSVQVTAAGTTRAGPSARPKSGVGVACVDGQVARDEVPCISSAGWWSNSLQCYVKALDPLPPLIDPFWQGHTTGALYMCTTPFVPSTRVVWLAAPPPGLPVTPGRLALRALSLVRVPRPVVQRSPLVDNSDNGVPYTWVNVWTWWWTTPQTWTPRSATARAGAVFATVTVSPSRMVITPGDGGAPVTCAGAGRPWTEADADKPPSTGGCGYRYRHVTATGPLTATLSVTWTVTWVGSGGTSGTLAPLTTTSASSFVVEQIQVVNR